MEKINFEELGLKLLKINDALEDVFGSCELNSFANGVYFIGLENGKKYFCDNEKFDCLCFTYRADYDFEGYVFKLVEDEIIVNQIKIAQHRNGYLVEVVTRLYGKSRFDKNKKALLDLESTTYVMNNYAYENLLDEDYLKEHSLLTTTFSAHMKGFKQVEGEAREIASTIYPSHVYFNGNDISSTYEFIDGIDKVSRIYNLYIGNVDKDCEDLEMLNTGLVDVSSLGYRKRMIGDEVFKLIGEKMDYDVFDEMLDEHIAHRRKDKPVKRSLGDATITEAGITPGQSRERLNNKIENITNPGTKLTRLIRGLVPNWQKKGNKQC